ncbi:MAG: hypothetical protein Q8N02_11935 [Methylotenera sp.]|nr:hypothetical protein [Methylotenera sp.]
MVKNLEALGVAFVSVTENIDVSCLWCIGRVRTQPNTRTYISRFNGCQSAGQGRRAQSCAG